jgi:hypothetical protein
MLSETWDAWEKANRPQLRQVVGEVDETHPALRAHQCIHCLCQRIEERNATAIALALSLLKHDPRLPFGRSLKSQIARSFKAIAEHLDGYQRSQLMQYRDKLRSLTYPPAELKYFERLGRALER